MAEPTGEGGSLEVSNRQVQGGEGPTFRRPMELAVTSGGDEVRSRIEVLGRETVINIEMRGSEPTSIILDPDGWVLKGGE